MMDSTSHPIPSHHWSELLEIGVFILLVLIALIFVVRWSSVKSGSNNSEISNNTIKRNWLDTPETTLVVLALPLQLLWEIAQFPLYTVWHEGDWSYILYGLVHCTLGDLLIHLGAFWIISLLNRSRRWIYSPKLVNVLLFIIIGLGYTIYSEIVNTRIKGTWGYTENMPIVPVFDIGGTPFMQWLLIPPVLQWLINIISQQNIKIR